MELALLLRYWQWGTLIALLGVGALAYHEHNARLVAQGIAIQKSHVADSTLTVNAARMALLEKQAARVDTVYAHDTVRVPKLIARTDSLGVKLLAALRDSIRAHPGQAFHDTTLVIRYIAATDSTLRACTSLLNDCAEKSAIAANRIATLVSDTLALHVKLAAQPAAQPRSCLGQSLLGGLLGLGAGYAIRR